MSKEQERTIVTALHSQLEKFKGDLLVVGLFKEVTRVPAELAGIDEAAGGVIGNLLRLGDFCGNLNETALLYASVRSNCRRIMLIGLGERGKFDLGVLRQAAGTAARSAERLGAGRICMGLHLTAGELFDAAMVGQAITEGAVAGRYTYQDYLPVKKENGKQVSTMRMTLVEPKASLARKLNHGCKIGTPQARGQNQARAIANQPGNQINPPSLAREAKRLARQFGLNCKVFDDRKLEQMGMNALLAVGAGSAGKARLIMLEHKGRRPGKRKNGGPQVVIVGKAITFDSGGLSIKPSSNMEAMKFDKSGGCAVLGVMAAVSALKLSLHVVGLIPAAENLPSHSSYRPGDIVRTYSGKTVEVQNTDAEGRLILSDALAYAVKMKPGAIVDIATLTGGCAIALGEHHAGLFGNNEKLLGKLLKASELSYERLWRMPSGPEYLEQMRSKIADLKNVGGRDGSPCTAAAFLGEFVGDVPWAHIDIAAVADTDKEKPYRAVGATGFGVRLIMEFLRAY